TKSNMEYDKSLCFDREFYEDIGEPLSWVRLYQAVNVQQKVSLNIYEYITYSELKKRFKSVANQIKDYLIFEIQKGPHFPSGIKSPGKIMEAINNCTIYNFSYCRILFNVELPSSVRIAAFFAA